MASSSLARDALDTLEREKMLKSAEKMLEVCVAVAIIIHQWDESHNIYLVNFI